MRIYELKQGHDKPTVAIDLDNIASVSNVESNRFFVGFKWNIPAITVDFYHINFTNKVDGYNYYSSGDFDKNQKIAEDYRKELLEKWQKT